MAARLYAIHPLLVGLIALIGSILCATTFSPLLILFLSVLPLMAAGCYYYHMKQSWPLIWALFFAVGAWRTTDLLQHYSLWHFDKKPIEAIGTIAAISQVEHARASECFIVELQEINGEKSDQTIAIYTKKSPHLRIADKIHIYELKIKKPKKDAFNLYLMKEGITASGFIDELNCTLVERPEYSLKRFIGELRDTLRNLLSDKLNTQTFSLFSSLFLGNRQTHKKELTLTGDHFKRWGIAHYLARSGLHLIIFAWVWHSVFFLIPAPFFIKDLLLLIVCGIYTLLSWLSISFIRALTVFLLGKCCIASNCTPNTLYLLTLSCCFLLLLNPIQLFFLDFQLTFCLTFGIAYYNWSRIHQLQ